MLAQEVMPRPPTVFPHSDYALPVWCLVSLVSLHLFQLSDRQGSYIHSPCSSPEGLWDLFAALPQGATLPLDLTEHVYTRVHMCKHTHVQP